VKFPHAGAGELRVRKQRTGGVEVGFADENLGRSRDRVSATVVGLNAEGGLGAAARTI